MRECGFRAAVTCEYGANPAPFTHFELTRTIVERSDPLWLFRARLGGRVRRAAARSPPAPRRAPRGVTPRLLVVVTLAEAGGAQTFAASLRRGLRGRYEIEVAAHGPEGALVDACAAAGRAVPPRRAPRARSRIPCHDAAAVRELRALARADRARRGADQLVQGRRAGAPGARRAAASPSVFTAHGWAFSGRSGAAGRAYALAERAVAPLADAIVCVSGHDLRLARRSAASPPRRGLHVIHNGVDAPAVLPPRRAPGPSGRVLGCTARLAPPKDLLTLLDALAQPGCERWRAARVRRRPRPRRRSRAPRTSSAWASA